MRAIIILLVLVASVLGKPEVKQKESLPSGPIITENSPLQLTDDPVEDVNPFLLKDKQRNLHVFWESMRGGSRGIFWKTCQAGEWSETRTVINDSLYHFSPMALNNIWVYNYYGHSSFAMDYLYNYEGTLQWKVIDSTSTDSFYIFTFQSIFNGTYTYALNNDTFFTPDTLLNYSNTTEFTVRQRKEDSLLEYTIELFPSFTPPNPAYIVQENLFFFGIEYRYQDSIETDTLNVYCNYGGACYVKDVGLYHLGTSNLAHHRHEYSMYLLSYTKGPGFFRLQKTGLAVLKMTVTISSYFL